MEILDSDDKIYSAKDKNLALISLLGYLITGLIALVALYGSWLSFSTLITSSAPDAVQLSRGIGISNYAQIAMIVTLLISVICRNVSISKYSFHTPTVWWLILTVTVLALFGSFIPVSPLLLVVVVVSFIHLFNKKSLYFNDEI